MNWHVHAKGDTVRLDSAKVVWKDNEWATAIDIPVEILPNGWIYTPETDCFHPPTEVVKVEQFGDREQTGGENNG